MKKLINIGLSLITLILLITSKSYAGSQLVPSSTDKYYVNVEGKITNELVKQVKIHLFTAYHANEHAPVVFLKSYGGYINAGLELGRLLRKFSAHAVVDEICASSCALAFIGAEYKTIRSGQVVTHSPFVRTATGIQCRTTSSTTGLQVMDYSREMIGDKSDLFVFNMFSVCGEDKGYSYTSTEEL